jgi:hypothetical protein
MNRSAFQSIGSVSRLCLATIIMTLVMTIPALAGVSLTAMPDAADANAMEQYRIKVFYEAQKSEQAKLRVGQERYDRMLTNRAIIVQAMAAELADREQQVSIPSEPASGNSVDNKEPNTLSGTLIGTAIIGLGFLGFRSYLNRQSSKGAARQN